MKWIALITIFIIILLVIALIAAEKPKMEVVPEVDLSKYLGKWYEIATIPQRFQKGCVCVIAEYSLRPDGKIKVVNSCRKNSPSGEFRQVIGVAKVVPNSNNAKLKVSFFRPFWGDYWIVALDKNYQWAIVSNPKATTCWILSRTPQIDKALYDQLLEICQKKGIDTTKIVPTLQACQ